MKPKQIFYFWLPLASTWLMMSIEGPFLSALIARLPDPKFNLAAYGVAFSFALIIESPVIMMMSASTALVKDNFSFLKLKKFNYALSLTLTLAMVLFNIPQIFYFIAETLIKLPPEVSDLTHKATLILLPWPGAIGYRRFYQGILIRNNQTKLVALGTIVRLITMSITAALLYFFTNVDGVVAGASSLSVAVICEALASRIMVSPILKKVETEIIAEKLSYNEIIKFYLPLALTSLLTLGVQPFVTFFIGSSPMAIESLAVMPVVTSFVFIFRGLGLSYQEVVIALINNQKENYISLKKFAFQLAAVLAGVLIFIAFTPLADIWLRNISGLEKSLADFSRLPLMIMAIFPAFTVWISFQRAVIVFGKQTSSITIGTAIEFVVIISVLMLMINYFSAVGAVAATTAFVIGRLCADLFLTIPFKKIIKNNFPNSTDIK